MARQRSVKYSSRRLRGWQLAALAGAVGALAVAGCSSSSSSSTQQHRQQHRPGDRRVVVGAR